MTEERQFPSRLLRFDERHAAAGPTFDPGRINMHIEGRATSQRIMTDAEVDDLLNDPFATLVLRRGSFPKNLTELLAAIDEHDSSQDGLPETSSFLVSEGGQLAFAPGVDKGGSRLLTVRSRGTSAELMISTLVPPGVSPRSSRLLLEVIAWDPRNHTFHFYQRQRGAWFWCGQSDMAFDDDTRGEGPFDSHINGYPNMKELKTPWVHWHGPGLGIAETAYAPDDPMRSDPLFRDRIHALIFEKRVAVPLINRWNEARFTKAIQGGPLSPLPMFMRQVIGSTSVNLISTHVQFANLADEDLGDLPPTFFVDQDCLIDMAGVGLRVRIPQLRMARHRYADLIDRYDLRVRGGSVDLPGDLPFCFVVPERALEDAVVVHGLIVRGLLTQRLAACLLMVDFANPLDSPIRAGLLRHAPPDARLDGPLDLEATLVPAILDAAAGTAEGSAERQFADHWELGPDAWRTEFADRIERYLARVVERLGTDEGCDEIFRLAESRRRVFRRMPLAEFDLTLPIAAAIPENAPVLEMTEEAIVQPRS
jgi:hypothetical protein